MKSRRRWCAVVLLVAGCQAAPADEGVSSLDAIIAVERSAIVVIDVRSERERRAGVPRAAVVSIQFGPDDWTGTVSPEQAADFVARVRPVAATGKPIVVLCQTGIRSAHAARELRRHGIAAETVTDGYLGNLHGPGWRTWE